MVKKCSDITLHEFPDFNLDTKCISCGKTVKEIQEEYFDAHISEFHKLGG